MASRSRRRHHEKGIALVAVLLVAALLAAIAAAFTLNTRTQTIVARNTVEGAKARALADAGVNWAVYLIAHPDKSLAPPANGTPVEHTFEGGIVTVTVQDEGGKVDLNRGRDEHLKGLFMVVGVEPADADALADAIADYRDADDLKRLNGAEDDDYRAAGLKHGAKDARFESVDELRRVLGMTDELFARVAPFLTVHSARKQVDLRTAPREVLLAVPNAIPAEIDTLMDARQGDTGIVGRKALPIPNVGRGSFSVSNRKTLTIRAQAVTTDGAVFIREAIVRLGKGKDRPYTVLEWRQGPPRNIPSPGPLTRPPSPRGEG